MLGIFFGVKCYARSLCLSLAFNFKSSAHNFFYYVTQRTGDFIGRCHFDVRNNSKNQIIFLTTTFASLVRFARVRYNLDNWINSSYYKNVLIAISTFNFNEHSYRKSLKQKNYLCRYFGLKFWSKSTTSRYNKLENETYKSQRFT